MKEEEILRVLESENEHLNVVIKTYLRSSLDKPVLGYQKFGDIKSTLLYGLNEHRITNHQENGYDYEKKTLGELYKQFDISSSELKEFIEGINSILDSYTDNLLSNEEKRGILSNQLKSFTYGKSDKILGKIYDKLTQGENTWNSSYLDSIIQDMRKLRINQLSNNKYIILTRIFQTYDSFHQYSHEFNEKKKYLQKLKNKNETDKIPDLLVKYFKKIYKEEHTQKDALKAIQWFYFYLMHGRAKLMAYLMDSVLGYKFKSTQKFIQKLFLIDHTSGQSQDNFNFSHHNWIAEVDTVEYAEEAKYNPLYQEIIKNL